MSQSDAGKGDDPRPVDAKKWDDGYTGVHWCNEPRWTWVYGKLNIRRCVNCGYLRDVSGLSLDEGCPVSETPDGLTVDWCKHEWERLCGMPNRVKCYKCNTLKEYSDC